jgi:hypothetical protein
VKAANLGAKFLLELAALASFAYWGASIGSGATSVVIAIAAPILAAVLWGRFAAPNSPRRLPTSQRVPFEMIVFALAALALIASGATLVAALFVAAAIVNALLLTRFDQWTA